MILTREQEAKRAEAMEEYFTSLEMGIIMTALNILIKEWEVNLDDSRLQEIARNLRYNAFNPTS